MMKKAPHSPRFSIRKTLFALLACSVCLVGVIGLAAFQVSFTQYDQTVYDLAYEVLNLYTANIENELYNIEKYTYSVATNSQLQAYLQTAGGINGPRRSVYREVVSHLAYLLMSEAYAESVVVVDQAGTVYSQGTRFTYPEGRLEEIAQAAARREGASVILPPADGEPCIVFARQIRRMEYVDLEPLGTLIVRINPEALSGYAARYAGRYSGNLSIYAGDHPVLDGRGAAGGGFIGEILRRQEEGGGSEGFFIGREEGVESFVVYSRSSETGWTYIHALSYGEIFRESLRIRQVTVVFLVVVLVLVLALGMVVANHISKPVISLSNTMSRVEAGDFQIPREEERQGRIFREIQQLWDDYTIMIRRIDSLINENYKGELLRKEAQLKWLEAQINPHFLYNTLEAINWMARVDGNEKIAVMAKSLGNLMRSAVSRDAEGVIALSREIQLLQDYLRIQQLRHEDRLSVCFDIQPGAENGAIPRLTLQPIVENAVHYALEAMTGICRIAVTARLEGEELLLSVADNGPGIPAERIAAILDGSAVTTGTGLGIRNIRQRLEILYGGAGSLAISSPAGQGTEVRIRIPYEEVEYDV